MEQPERTVTVTRLDRTTERGNTLAWAEVRCAGLRLQRWRVYQARREVRVMRPPFVEVEDAALAAEIVRCVLHAYREQVDSVDVLLGEMK